MTPQQVWEAMRDRLILGGLRYGLLGAPEKPQYNRVADIVRRSEEYTATGNDELLVDIANLALLEFVEGCHPHKHWGVTDDGKHTTPQTV